MPKIMNMWQEVVGTKIGESEDDAEAYYAECCFEWHDAEEDEIEEYEEEWFSI